jgi:hypothetical protein
VASDVCFRDLFFRIADNSWIEWCDRECGVMTVERTRGASTQEDRGCLTRSQVVGRFEQCQVVEKAAKCVLEKTPVTVSCRITETRPLWETVRESTRMLQLLNSGMPSQS